LHKVFDLAIGKGPRDDELLPRRERIVQLMANEVVGDFEGLRLRCGRRSATGRHRRVSFRRRQAARAQVQVPRGQPLAITRFGVLRAQAYACLDFLSSQKKTKSG
jgi:hypothetical protein